MRPGDIVRLSDGGQRAVIIVLYLADEPQERDEGTHFRVWTLGRDTVNDQIEDTGYPCTPILTVNVLAYLIDDCRYVVRPENAFEEG